MRFYFVRIVGKILSAVVLSVCFVAHNSQPAQAFFTENYKKNLNYGVFKKAYNTELYIGVNASFLMKTWMPNITTTVMGSEKWLNTLNSAVPGYMTKNPISKYSYGLGMSIGLHSSGSSFRHELMFERYSILSKTMKLAGGENLPTGKENETIQATNIGGKYYQDIGVYSNIYRVTYNMFYNFQNAFNLFNTDWDVYLGVGAGLAIVRAGIYSTSKIRETIATAQQTIPATQQSGDQSEQPSSTSSQNRDTVINRYRDQGYQVVNQEMQEDGSEIISFEKRTYALEKSSISSANSAGKHKLMAKNYFAAAYQFQVGVLANLSQSFAMNIGVTFAGTSRPFFSTDFKSVKSVAGSRMNFEYHIALNVGLLIKSLELAL